MWVCHHALPFSHNMPPSHITCVTNIMCACKTVHCPLCKSSLHLCYLACSNLLRSPQSISHLCTFLEDMISFPSYNTLLEFKHVITNMYWVVCGQGVVMHIHFILSKGLGANTNDIKCRMLFAILKLKSIFFIISITRTCEYAWEKFVVWVWYKS